jgi:ferrous iron transport protein B
MKKEFGGRMAAFSVTFQLLLAWIVSFGIFNIGKMIMAVFS